MNFFLTYGTLLQHMLLKIVELYCEFYFLAQHRLEVVVVQVLKLYWWQYIFFYLSKKHLQ